MSRSVFDPMAGQPEPIMVPVSQDDIIDRLTHSFVHEPHGHDAGVSFIVALDLAMASWDFTEILIAHFKAIEAEFEKEEPGSTPIEPKKFEHLNP